jgi:hypothetical protein
MISRAAGRKRRDSARVLEMQVLLYKDQPKAHEVHDFI